MYKKILVRGVLAAVLTGMLLLSGCDEKKKIERIDLQEFQAMDLDGNEVTQQIFKNADVTMINVWGTFCGPCIDEMPELGEFAREYADKNVQVIGVVSDVPYTETGSQDMANKVRKIMKQTGADYLQLHTSKDLDRLLVSNVLGYPTNILVDKNGKLISDSEIVGGTRQDWEDAADQALREVKE